MFVSTTIVYDREIHVTYFSDDEQISASGSAGTSSSTSLERHHTSLSMPEQRNRLTEEIKTMLNQHLPLDKQVSQVPWATMHLLCYAQELWWEGVKLDFQWDGVRKTHRAEVCGDSWAELGWF